MPITNVVLLHFRHLCSIVAPGGPGSRPGPATLYPPHAQTATLRWRLTCWMTTSWMTSWMMMTPWTLTSYSTSPMTSLPQAQVGSETHIFI